jgi:hypothetical protein
MFGQPMPLRAVDAACAAIDDADLLFVVGSTLLVQPANELPCLALRNAAPVVMINFDATQYDTYCKGLVRQKAGEFLGAVADELERKPSSIGSAVPLRPDCEEIGKSLKQSPEQLKEVRVGKEGSRCGKEISVNTKSCGIAFFCTALVEPQGNFEYLEHSLAAMNQECSNIGKMIFSDGPEQLAVIAFVPEILASMVNPADWLEAVAQAIGGVIFEVKGTWAKLMIPAGPDVYPIKLKEPGITAAIAYLKGIGLFPDLDDDDDIVYGDHDFPS